jgi:hypothetical protein
MRVTSSISGCDQTKTGYLAGMPMSSKLKTNFKKSDYIIIDEVFYDNFLVIIYLLVVYKKNNNIKIKSK